MIKSVNVQYFSIKPYVWQRDSNIYPKHMTLRRISSNSDKVPQLFISDSSKAVVLLWLYVACFGVRVSVTFHLKCVHIIFSSV